MAGPLPCVVDALLSLGPYFNAESHFGPRARMVPALAVFAGSPIISWWLHAWGSKS